MKTQVKSEDAALYVVPARPESSDDETIRRALAILEARAMRGPALESPATTRDWLRLKLGELPHEVFCCLFLDNRHRVLAFEELFRGTLNGTAVYPREIVKRALAHNAAAVWGNTMSLYNTLPITSLPSALVALLILADFSVFYILGLMAFGG